MGRNGAGKSRFFRHLDQFCPREEFNIRYISPERAGSFKRDGNILTHMSNNPEWLRNSRLGNQADNFKAASAVLLRETETIYLRKLQADPEIRQDLSRTFVVDRLEKINRLLTNIVLVVGTNDLEFRTISDNELVAPEKISSGESEAVALASEILHFFDTLDLAKFNVLLLDEPDVHLHPDLQARLGQLLLSMLEEFESHRDRIAVCLATHSAPLVCALASSPQASIGTKSFGVDIVQLKPTGRELRKVAPFFGHPLSLSLSNDAPLILEGEDDERVWQQAARSSKGQIKVFPVLAESVDQQGALERFCVDLLETLYDDPVAFSLRDGDGVVGEQLAHLPPLRRFRLQCYAIENTLVTDQCLSTMGASWREFIEKAKNWVIENPVHKDIDEIRCLIGSSDRQRHKKIKTIRQLICAILNCNKPWEVVVGQALGGIERSNLQEENMLVDFIGEELARDVILRGE